MRSKALSRWVMTSLIVAASVGMTSAYGDLVLVSNFANTQTDVDTVSAMSAQGFVTGDRALTLTSIEAVLGGTLDPDSIDATAKLYGSTIVGGVDVPDTSNPLATFVFPGLDVDQVARTFTPSTTGLVLQANTEYWFVVDNVKGNTAPFHWGYTGDTTNNPLYEGQLTTLRTSSDDGASWRLPIVPYAYLLQVNGASVSVPEPSGLVISGLGFSMILVGHRRRRAASIAG